jgi:hypothetical protein
VPSTFITKRKTTVNLMWSDFTYFTVISSYILLSVMSIPVAVPSKVRFCGRSLAGVAGSNATGGMDVCVVCVVQYGKKAKC